MFCTKAKSTDVPRPPPPPIPQGDQPRQPIVPPAPSDRFLGLGPPPLSSAPAQPLLPPPRPSGRLDKPVTPPVMTRGDRPRVPLVPPSVSAVRPGMQRLGSRSRGRLLNWEGKGLWDCGLCQKTPGWRCLCPNNSLSNHRECLKVHRCASLRGVACFEGRGHHESYFSGVAASS